MKVRVVLIGGFDEARYLAKSLIEKGYDVTAINERINECDALAEVSRLSVFHGDGSKPYILEDANVYGADIVIAMSPYDDANLVICELCKKRFKVRKTVALINDPKNTEFFKKMGVDSVVCSVSILSDVIEQNAVLSNIKTIMPIGSGQVQVEQIVVPEGARSIGKTLTELNLPRDILVGCIMRDDSSLIPRGDTVILAGDVLVVIVSAQYRDLALEELTGQ